MRGWRLTTTPCFYCGALLRALIHVPRQRCPNDCASGLGECPTDRLADARGRVGTVECDAVVGVLDTSSGER